MEIEQRERDGIHILSLRGQVETFGLPALSKAVDTLIEGGARRFCLNFRDVAFINSTALGYLVELASRLRDLEGEIVFSQPSKFFEATVRTLELHHIFEVFPSDADALAHYQAD